MTMDTVEHDLLAETLRKTMSAASGRVLDLAMIELAASLKLLLYVSVIACLFFPIGLGGGFVVGLAAYIAKLAVAGVLLVFSYLIVPAVCAIALARRVGVRLLIGWIVSLVGGIGGLYLSFYGDFPSGAAIVCTLGGLLILVALVGLFRKRAPTPSIS